MRFLAALLLWPCVALAQVGYFPANVGLSPRPDSQLMFTNPVGSNHALIAGVQSMKPGCQVVNDCNREVAFTTYGWDVTGTYLLQMGSFRAQWAVPPTYPNGYATLGLCAGRVYGNETCMLNVFGDGTATFGGNSTAPFTKPQTGNIVMLWVNGIAPTAPDPAGVLLWAEGGKLKAMSSTGTITVLTP